jgi:hypothetical protein
MNAMTGKGVDRHLFALYIVSKGMNVESPFLQVSNHAYVCVLGLIILPILGFYDNSMREKDWRCRKRGAQAT